MAEGNAGEKPVIIKPELQLGGTRVSFCITENLCRCGYKPAKGTYVLQITTIGPTEALRHEWESTWPLDCQSQYINDHCSCEI